MVQHRFGDFDLVSYSMVSQPADVYAQVDARGMIYAISIMNMPSDVVPGDMLRLLSMYLESRGAIYIGPSGRPAEHVLLINGCITHGRVSQYSEYSPLYRVDVVSRADG